jgi:hypothetical protein
MPAELCRLAASARPGFLFAVGDSKIGFDDVTFSNASQYLPVPVGPAVSVSVNSSAATPPKQYLSTQIRLEAGVPPFEFVGTIIRVRRYHYSNSSVPLFE